MNDMPEVILTTIALTLFSTVMIVSLAVGRNFIIAQMFTNISSVNLVFFFAVYKVLAYYVAPIIFNLISDFRYVREDGVELFSLAYLYAIETISWLAWLTGFIAVAVLYKKKIILNDSDLFAENNDGLNKWVLVLVSVGFVYLRMTSLGELLDQNFGYPWYLEVTKSILAYAGPPASIILLVIGFMRWGFLFGTLGFVAFVAGLAMVSTRGALIYSIVFLVYLSFILSVSKKVKALMAFGMFILFMAYFLFGGLPTIAVSLHNDNTYSVELGVAAEKKGDKTSFEEIEWRFGALSRMSTKFIDMYDRGDGAGINPIKNSLLGVLPRSVNPEKPHPSTVDGNDIYSQGMYLLSREIYGYNTYSMVEFSSGGHAYWEFGWLGVLVLGVVSGIYIGLCVYYFQKLGLLSIPLIVAVFKPWGYVDPKIWVSDIVIQVYQIIIPLFLIVMVCKLLIFVRRFLLKSPTMAIQAR